MKIYIVVFVFTSSLLFAQQTATPKTAVTNTKTISPETALVHSLVLPGWGQLNQEKLWHSALFFGVGTSLYYNAAYQLYRSAHSNEKWRQDKGRTILSMAVFFHLLNVLDAWDRSIHEKPQYWNSSLFSNKPLKSPWGASLRSLMLPGWGQIYNEQYLKAGMFAGLTGYISYTIYNNDRLYKRTHEGRYLDQRTRFYWYLGLSYILMIGDAQVDAYLYKFDKTTKLLINPKITNNSTSLNFRLEF